MFGTIRRHQKWLWIVIAGLTILSFVAFGPTNSRFGKLVGRNSEAYGILNGQPISLEDFNKARNEVLLEGFLSSGEWPDAPNSGKTPFEITRDSYFRLLMQEKEKELGIQVSAESVADFARVVLSNFRMDNLDRFEQAVLTPRGMNLSDFDNFLRGRVALMQMASVAGTTGKLVTPQEAAEMYKKEHQELSASMVYFSASNYLSGVTVSPDALATYYSNRQAMYAIPTKVQVDYVRFPASNYLAQAKANITNLDAIVEQDYQKYGTNAEFLSKTPEEAKAKIRDEVLRNARNGELALARKTANQFVTELDAMPARSAANLQALAAKQGLSVGTTDPFDEEGGPSGWHVSDAFLKEAFALDPTNRPMSIEVAAEDGYYVLAYKSVIPSTIPPLTSIETKVTSDYRMLMAGTLARQAGAKFVNSLTNGLPAGKTFAAAATDAGLKAENLPPFSLSTTNLPAGIEDRIGIRQLIQVGFGTEVGKVSSFVPTHDGGLVLYAQSLAPVSDEQLKREVPDFLTMLRQVRQSDAFNEWFNVQIQQDQGLVQTLTQLSKDAQKERAGGRKSTM
jgi:hypothetical protein